MRCSISRLVIGFFFFFIQVFASRGFIRKGSGGFHVARFEKHLPHRRTARRCYEPRGCFLVREQSGRARKRGTRFCFLFERRTFKWPWRWNYRLERSCVESSCSTPCLEQCVPLQACFYPRGQFIPRDSRWIDISSPSRLKRRNKCQGIAVFTLYSRYIYMAIAC
mgnify:CR=1 FL=1